MVGEPRRFRIGSLLGEGGFGRVYRGTLLGAGGFSKPVAIKLLNQGVERDDDIARRFRDEARMLGLIRHRAIVHVDGLVRLAGRWAVVMELVEGATLQELTRDEAIPPGPAAELAAEVASALHAAWSATGPQGRPLRLLHRDVKPANIQLTHRGEVKLLDFGIAKADFDAREARTQDLQYGTPGYVSPERLVSPHQLDDAGGSLEDDIAGDIYALGAVLHRAMLQRRFDGWPLFHERHDQRVADAVSALEAATGGRAPRLAALVGRMLRHDPTARPSPLEVEREASEIARQEGQQRLRDWAGSRIAAVARARGLSDPDALMDQTLVEEFHTGEPPPVEPAPRAVAPGEVSVPTLRTDRRAHRGWLLPVGVSVLGLAASAVLGWHLARSEPQRELPAAPPRQETVRAPDPEDPATVLAASTDLPEAAATRAVQGAPAPPPPTVTTTGPAPSPASAPAARPTPPGATASVEVSGDGSHPQLRGPQGPVPLGAVPPGAYDLLVDFGQGPVVAARLSLAAGQRVSLRCNARFTRCAPR